MGRRQYLADLSTASALCLPNISKVRSGEDGEFTFELSAPSLKRNVRIHAVVPNLADYPKSHDYIVFASDDAPSAIASAVERHPDLIGLDVPQLLSVLSKYLASKSRNSPAPRSSQSRNSPAPHASKSRNSPALHAPTSRSSPAPHAHASRSGSSSKAPMGSRARPIEILTSEEENGFGDGEDYDDDDDDDLWPIDEVDGIGSPLQSQPISQAPPDAAHLDKLREDLRAARDQGFRVGVNGTIRSGASIYVNVSCHVSKLPISDEARQAWSLNPSDYLVLLMYYPEGYRRAVLPANPFEHRAGRKTPEFRVAVCDHYKAPSHDDARRFFAKQPCAGLRDTFISRALNALFNERFLPLVGLRVAFDLNWSGAEYFLEDCLGSSAKNSKPKPEYLSLDDGASVRKGFIGALTADCLKDHRKGAPVAVPLLAAQFLIRHFVGCTWFCLVCHCKIRDRVEAIKPYVCNKLLCLYQYMEFGLGPSLDHEIKSQPLVVDLLISFCYAAAAGGGFREFPQIKCKVPSPNGLPPRPITSHMSVGSMLHQVRQGGTSSLAAPDGYADSMTSADNPHHHFAGLQAKLLLRDMKLVFRDSRYSPKRGEWIVVKRNHHTLWHCRVEQPDAHGDGVLLSKTPLVGWTSVDAKTNHPLGFVETISTSEIVDVTAHPYDIDFDMLNDYDKAVVVCGLLDSMPKVSDMRAYLNQGHGREIEKWLDKLSPAHITLLRWILASNRSCIMQVDEVLANSSPNKKIQLGVRDGEQRINGLGEWLQFRFAMGSPDKEARFTSALSAGNRDFPSMFAWHGSPFANWHSIIRNGLDYSKTMHGRAFGHGVYFSRHWHTSMGYTGGGSFQHSRNRSTYGDSRTSMTWPQSLLETSTAIALVEIVNAPDQFVSQSPHYVVQHTDWIQTRYLFARPAVGDTIQVAKDKFDVQFLPQDPKSKPEGPMGIIELPIGVVPKSRQPQAAVDTQMREPSPLLTAPRTGKRRLSGSRVDGVGPSNINGAGADHKHDDDGYDTDTTAREDREFLGKKNEPSASKSPKSPTPKPPTPVTAFTPEPISGLKMMPPPPYATHQGTLSLHRAYKALVSTQEDHMKRGRLWELGWYVDVEHISNSENMYHWVAGLHSFPMELPLAQDMAQRGIQSIVLEMRFPHNFPFSPPFIRVVRPRFLAFAHGGGGHVTAGGSICMDLLTSSGWNPASSMESVLLNIRMAMMSTTPQPARLDGHHNPTRARNAPMAEYNVQEAVGAFIRACNMHGWTVPAELSQMTMH